MQSFSDEHIRALSALAGSGDFSTGQSNRELHLRDISAHRGIMPAGVLWPRSTDQTAALMAYCYEQNIPLTPWGAGTSTEGNPVPQRGGLVIDFTRMNRVLAIRTEDLQADVQPGVLRKELNRQAGRYGLFFPPDPGADATIGGMIANNASGVQTVKYGATKDYIMHMTVVLPQGKVIRTGCKANKSSSGYDLTRLFVGSEGTLGVVTEATVRLAGIPSHRLAATVAFNRLEDAGNAVAAMMGSGLGPAALELLTPPLIQLLNRENQLALAEIPMLFCEFHGISRTVLSETAVLAEELCRDCGAVVFQSGMQEAERTELWRARHEAWETIHRAHPGCDTLIVDAAVPISTYPAMVVYAQEMVDSMGVTGYVFGHAGDGNLHVVIAGDPEDRDHWALMEKVNDAIVTRAVEVGGTCTGEHGIGIGKRKFMQMEHGESLELMRQIKTLIDPKGLMNPGKIFP